MDQYEILMRCSDKKDVTEWNEWREKNPDQDILLEGANIARHRKVSPGQVVGSVAYLQEINLSNAYLKGANLVLANLQGAHLAGAYMEGANFQSSHLERAYMVQAHMKEAKLLAAYLNDADLMFADLEGAILNSAYLNSAQLHWTNLRGAYLRYTHIKNTRFGQAIVDGLTTFWECEVDRNTDFRGVSLGNISIDPGTKQLLEYNVRRKNWEHWYPKQNWSLACLVRKFWQISDYGISTKGVIKTFFKWAFIFATVYYISGQIAPPGIVDNLFANRNGIAVQWWLVPFRTLYFSIVTMTTLGFGDMFANAHSLWGHVLLSIQVILGYVLLGALVTRFAVLFTAGGPAGKFFKGYCPKPKTGWDELAADTTILQTGDVIHVQNAGLLSMLVRFFSRAWKEEPSWASHTAMVLRVGEEIEIIEAMWRTIIRPITEYKGKKSKLLVCRKPGSIDQEQKRRMIEKAEYYKGKTYGFWKIALHMLDRLLNNRYVFRRLIKDNEYPICSWLVAYVYDRVLKYQFGAPPNAAQPDDLLDHCLDYDWEFIWADSGESVADFCRTYKLSDKNDVA